MCDMRIYWHTDSNEDRLLLPETEEECSFEVIRDDEIHSTGSNFDLLIINANLGKNRRSKRTGLQRLQKLRRDYRLLAHAIVYSFESYETLIKEHPILKKGVSFIRL